MPAPPGCWSPLTAPEIPDADRASLFRRWVSTYWGPLHTLSDITAEACQHENFKDIYEVTSDSKYIPSTDRMSGDELNGVTAPSVVARIGTPFDIADAVYAENFQYGLFDINGTWKKLKVVALWAEMSCVYCVWSARALSEILQSPAAEQHERRPIKQVKMDNANHFVSRRPCARPPFYRNLVR